MIVDDIPENMRVTMNDVRKAGYCPSGARRWFDAHGVDFRAFLANGMDARAFFALDDGHATKVLISKLGRERTNG